MKNNISYGALTALVTKNENERVQMGLLCFMFSLVANLFVASFSIDLRGILKVSCLPVLLLEAK